MVLYELNTRQFTPKGTFAAVTPHLREVKDLGVNVVWFMPVHPIGKKNRKGPLGSPYAVVDYRGINPEFGTLEDFRKLVKAAHGAGLHVIIDWVANHTAWDHPWVTQHPDWYVHDAAGKFVPPVADWTDVIKLDYSKPALREEMIRSMEFWVKDVGVDGFRCDVAGEVPTDFWEEARQHLEEIKPVFMLAEAEKPELLKRAFDADYGSEYFHLFDKIAHHQAGPSAIHKQVAQDYKRYPPNARRMIFSSNHDQNSWLDSDIHRLGPQGSQAFARLTFTLPGFPLIYNGQEVGNAKKLEFFQRDPIQWNGPSRRQLYKQWSELYREHPALFEGEYEAVENDAPSQVLSFQRQSGHERMLVVANLSERAVRVQVKTPTPGPLRALLGGAQPTMNAHMQPDLKMTPWQVLVFEFSR